MAQPALTPARSFGVLLPRDLSATDLRGYSRRAEALGFDELWVVEDLGFAGGLAQAAVALASTERIRVGVGIAPAAVRNPAFLAMEAATLASLFPGRFALGVGHGMPGWMRQVGAWPARPLALLEETLDAVRALLRGETVNGVGRYVQMDAVRLERPPAQVPPVLAGVRGPRSLALAGRAADGTVLAEPVTPEYLAVVQRHIAATRPHEIVAFAVAAVRENDPDARDAVRPALAWIGESDWEPHIAPLPFAAELADLRSSCATREEFAARLPDAWVDQLAVTGTREVARRRIDVLHDAGATTVVLLPTGPDPLDALEQLASVL